MGLLAILPLTAARTATAQGDFQWNVASGNFLTGTNWNPTGPPTDLDRALIDNGGTSTFSSGVHNVNELLVGSSAGTSGTFVMTGGDLTTVITRFGEVGTATATITNAALHAMTGEEDIFVGGENDTGTGTLTINGASSVVTAGDDFIMGRTGTGTLNVNAGLVKGGFTVVGKFGTGTWNHAGGVYDQSFGDIEIGDGGRPDQQDIAGPRTGIINLTGGVLHGAGHLAIGNRVGGGSVNISGGALAITGDANGTGTVFVGRGMDWEGNPGVGGATTFRVIGGASTIAVNGSFQMNPEGVASSSTLVAQITGKPHSTIQVAGDATITNGAFKVELSGYTPVSGDSWTILQAGADLSAAQTAIDALVSAGGYPAVAHFPGSDFDPTLTGPFASTDFTMAPLTPGLSWNVGYADNKVTLSVTGTAAIAGDFNHDNKVDGLDLQKWKNDFGAGAGSDADGDGDTDGADFLVWQRQVGAGAAVASVGAVPEPGSAWLLAVGAACAIRAAGRTRRR
jgi:T5SS/PEP-CTERM-associated repeat protein